MFKRKDDTVAVPTNNSVLEAISQAEFLSQRITNILVTSNPSSGTCVSVAASIGTERVDKQAQMLHDRIGEFEEVYKKFKELYDTHFESNKTQHNDSTIVWDCEGVLKHLNNLFLRELALRERTYKNFVGASRKVQELINILVGDGSARTLSAEEAEDCYEKASWIRDLISTTVVQNKFEPFYPGAKRKFNAADICYFWPQFKAGLLGEALEEYSKSDYSYDGYGSRIVQKNILSGRLQLPYEMPESFNLCVKAADSIIPMIQVVDYEITGYIAYMNSFHDVPSYSAAGDVFSDHWYPIPATLQERNMARIAITAMAMVAQHCNAIPPTEPQFNPRIVEFFKQYRTDEDIKQRLTAKQAHK